MPHIAKALALVRDPIGAWYDSELRDRAVWALLVFFVAAWSVFQIVSYASIGLHPDNLEMYGWAQHPSAGYAPHPPLGAWMVAAWFSLFPAADWSFHLLAMVNSGIALWAIDRIAARYVTGEKRLLVLLLLMLTPFYQFRGQRFSVNLTLLSTWPLATWCFLRAFQSRDVIWSAAAGATAALAMLGKYYSVYLIAGFIVAAFTNPERWRYLGSPSPWISILVGLLVLAPHLHWLATNEFQPFHYALAGHAGGSLPLAIKDAALYAVGGVLYVVLPVAVYVLIARPSPQVLRDALWPQDPKLRMLVILLLVPLVLPMLTAPLLGGLLVPLWTMQGWFLLPIILLAPDAVTPRRDVAVNVAAAIFAVTLAAVLAAPAIAWARFNHPGEPERVSYQGVSVQATELWHRMIGRPLTIVAGGGTLPNAVTFYSPDHPDSVLSFNFGLSRTVFAASPWITAERLRKEGWIALCESTDTDCIKLAGRRAARNPAARRVEFDSTASFFGMHRTAKFDVTVFPPAP